jgi:hypothetical protein
VTAASDPDILAGVERWARARGFWRARDTRMGSYDGWNICARDDFVRVWYGKTELEREVSPAVALAWALAVETDAAPVDVGWCPVCVKRGGPMEWARSGHRWPGSSFDHNMPSVWCSDGVRTPVPGREVTTCQFGDVIWWHSVRPCPACNGSGRETIPVARLLLDAASEDTTARERLLVHADHLQAIGDPRGELLALALGPWSGEPTRFEWFYASTEETSALMVADGWTRGPAKVPGVRLTHVGRRVAAWPFSRPVLPGTADALRWLEWLTWAREFAAERETRQMAATWAAGIGMPPALLAPRARPG